MAIKGWGWSRSQSKEKSEAGSEMKIFWLHNTEDPTFFVGSHPEDGEVGEDDLGEHERLLQQPPTTFRSQQGIHTAAWSAFWTWGWGYKSYCFCKKDLRSKVFQPLSTKKKLLLYNTLNLILMTKFYWGYLLAIHQMCLKEQKLKNVDITAGNTCFRLFVSKYSRASYSKCTTLECRG